MDKEIFLETTIQIDRNFSSRAIRTSVNEKLKDKKIISSTYVLGEIRFNLLKRAIDFYGLLKQSDDVMEALDRLNAFSTSQYAIELKVYISIAEDGQMETKELLRRLDILIEDLIDSRCKRGIKTSLLNETGCIRATVQPKYIDGLWKIEFGCNAKMKGKCNICSFVHEHAEEFDLIKKLGTEKVKELKKTNIPKMANVLSLICDNGKTPQGENCWKIGDVIISNEAPNDSVIYTTNIKDYKPICEKIGKELFNDCQEGGITK